MDDSTLSLIQRALQEDIGPGDVTSRYFLTDHLRSTAQLVAREPGIAYGVEVAETVFHQVDPDLTLRRLVNDGQTFAAGDVLMEVAGRTRSLLTAERTALNFIQHLSAIATQTAAYVRAVQPHPVQVWDTRKTTPGWRSLEKAAVKAGGGVNHRHGLYDAVMVKDNHLAANGTLETLQQGIDAVRATHPGMRVQIEAATLEQLSAFLTLRGVDMILLDNMTPATLREAVRINAGRLWLEASGGITLSSIGDFAATGVNAISVGALTHTVRALDLALDIP
ncbi:MAG: carboxylating nicotinate-nucleotide diphosphorylase [Verrucomicrobiales bacterium]|nr:carboxylating nicotinate-nucleotide diphosphorylase [Verrucomicrobiales bacterium]